ncbi:MAG TPA: flagellar assembly protein FliW [Fibrobacteria bacterium]|nr:flagellar assembly protein FliW [Fibrobacteria bacterium]
MKATQRITSGGVPWTEDQVISFPGGLPGFESARKFIIMSVPEHQPFHWMECVDEGNTIRFAIINPLSFRPDYQPKIKKEELASLNIQDPKELLLYVIVTLRTPLMESTANLMGPLFINIREKVGKQIIIENDAYSLRERIIP